MPTVRHLVCALFACSALADGLQPASSAAVAQTKIWCGRAKRGTPGVCASLGDYVDSPELTRAGLRYLVVAIFIENQSLVTVEVYPDNLILLTDNRAYRYSVEGTEGLCVQPFRRVILNPRQHATGCVVFPVQQSSQPTQLVWYRDDS